MYSVDRILDMEAQVIIHLIVQTRGMMMEGEVQIKVHFQDLILAILFHQLINLGINLRPFLLLMYKLNDKKNLN